MAYNLFGICHYTEYINSTRLKFALFNILKFLLRTPISWEYIFMFYDMISAINNNPCLF